MTNGEKYKTVEARAEAFDKFCHGHTACRVCKLRGTEQDVNKTYCTFRWLDTDDDPSIAKIVAKMRSKAAAMDVWDRLWYSQEEWNALCDNLDAAVKRAYERISVAMLSNNSDYIRNAMDETIGVHTTGGRNER